MERKLFILLTFCFNLAVLNAQEIFPPESTKDIHLEVSWKDINSSANKDLSEEVYAKYSAKELFIWFSYTECSNYYIINNRSRKIVLSSSISPTNSEATIVPLCSLPKGVYTLYIYEGDRFWYGSFTIER